MFLLPFNVRLDDFERNLQSIEFDLVPLIVIWRNENIAVLGRLSAFEPNIESSRLFP
jgi:hypothetical protein